MKTNFTMEEKVTLLSEFLYNRDPANTCCKENHCDDEYVHISRAINTKYGKDNRGPLVYIQEIFIESFDIRLDLNTLNKIALYLGVINGEFDNQ